MRFVWFGLVVIGCKGATTPTGEEDRIEVEFTAQAVAGDTAIGCGDSFMAGSPPVSVELADARFFMSDIKLQNADGEWIELELTPSDWQHEGIVLIDLEDGSAGCADSGTSDLNDRVVGSLPAGDYNGLQFTMGVPFELNHNDSAAAPAPLNSPGMFWTWQGGYKHLRLDVMGTSRFNVHMGTTGCVSDGPVVAPDAPCGRSNRSVIEFADFDPSSNTIELDVATILAGSDVEANTVDTPPGCQSNPMEPDDCSDIYSRLGLDFSTGACVSECAGQGVFSRR